MAEQWVFAESRHPGLVSQPKGFTLSTRLEWSGLGIIRHGLGACLCSSLDLGSEARFVVVEIPGEASFKKQW